MDEPKVRRRYHSLQRQTQAQLTRRAILEAARRLFGAHGYAATTLPAIAGEAGVSAPTVTAIFGTKARLLDALIKLAVRGDTTSSPLADRPWWQEMLAEPDPKEQLRLHATTTRQVHERSADVAEIVRGAATADPEIASLLRQRGALRLRDMRTVVESLAGKHALVPGMTIDQAMDLLWALTAADLYRLLVVERGWPPSQYERWLASSLIQSLLEHGHTAS